MTCAGGKFPSCTLHLSHVGWLYQSIFASATPEKETVVADAKYLPRSIERDEVHSNMTLGAFM